MILLSYRRLLIPFFLLLSLASFRVRPERPLRFFRVESRAPSRTARARPWPARPSNSATPRPGFERVAVTGENGDFNFAELASGHLPADGKQGKLQDLGAERNHDRPRAGQHGRSGSRGRKREFGVVQNTRPTRS